MKLLRLLPLICATLLFACSTLQPLENRFDDLQGLIHHLSELKLSDEEKSEGVARRYDVLFSAEMRTEGLASQPTEQLMLLYRAADETAFVTKRPQHADDFARVVAELDSRKLAQQNQFKALFDAFVRARMFLQASELLDAQPALASEGLPFFQTAQDALDGAPSEWVFSESSRVAERRAVDLNTDWQLIVVSHPLCHFSVAAMKAINADTGLMQKLAGHTKWIAPQDANFSFSVFQNWNRSHPNTKVTAVHRASDWPLRNFAATPTFYFLKNGKVVEEVTGWPAKGNRKLIIEALNRVTSP